MHRTIFERLEGGPHTSHMGKDEGCPALHTVESAERIFKLAELQRSGTFPFFAAVRTLCDP